MLTEFDIKKQRKAVQNKWDQKSAFSKLVPFSILNVIRKNVLLV